MKVRIERRSVPGGEWRQIIGSNHFAWMVRTKPDLYQRLLAGETVRDSICPWYEFRARPAATPSP
jgi:hypothetical protein